MEPRYQILATLYTIVKDDPQPEKYGCRPRELILRQLQDWNHIKSNLEALEQEGWVVLQQQETMIIHITPGGIQKILSLVKQRDTA